MKKHYCFILKSALHITALIDESIHAPVTLIFSDLATAAKGLPIVIFDENLSNNTDRLLKKSATLVDLDLLVSAETKLFDGHD